MEKNFFNIRAAMGVIVQQKKEQIRNDSSSKKDNYPK